METDAAFLLKDKLWQIIDKGIRRWEGYGWAGEDADGVWGMSDRDVMG